MFINSVWIMGLAVLLATFSYYYWQATDRQQSFMEQFNQPSFRRASWLGMSLVGIGLAGTSHYPWEIAVWLLFVTICAVQFIRSWREASSTT